MFMKSRLLAAVLPLAVVACGANEDSVTTSSTPADGGDETEIAASTIGDRVTLDGTVISAKPDSFELDYGTGRVTVGVEDWDAFHEGSLLRSGDRVIVRGRIDGGFLSNRSIEARSVYVLNLNTTFYASGADEEDFGLALTRNPTDVPIAGTADYTGWVTRVGDKGFTMGAGPLRVAVDIGSMDYDPLDEEGYQRVRRGQRVYVWGPLTLNDEDQLSLTARGVITLLPSRSSMAPGAAASPTDSPTSGNVMKNAILGAR